MFVLWLLIYLNKTCIDLSLIKWHIREFLRLTFQCVFWCDRKTQSLTFKSLENFQLKNEKNRRVRCFLLYFPEFMWPILCFVNNNAPKSTCWTWKIPFLSIFSTKMHRSFAMSRARRQKNRSTERQVKRKNSLIFKR